jgi:class 3 adenylate cyclase
MTEKLDPEEVKEIISQIFGQIAQVVGRYEGQVEKFIGDAVMAVFGIPKAHEDDPLRALWAAREIHEIVNTMSSQFEARVGKPLLMHTGINTGLVVTGEAMLEKEPMEPQVIRSILPHGCRVLPNRGRSWLARIPFCKPRGILNSRSRSPPE